jgi:hypothetical protein
VDVPSVAALTITSTDKGFAVLFVNGKEGIENEVTPVIESANFEGALKPVGMVENFQIYFTLAVNEENGIASEFVSEQISCVVLLSG